MIHFLWNLAVATLTAIFGVHWASSNSDAITIKAPGLEPFVEECLAGGLEARIRYDIRLCRRFAVWFDNCAGVRTQAHSISFDPVTDSYRVMSDRWGDGSAPIVVGIPSRPEALNSTLTVDDVLMSFLSHGDNKLASDKDAYVQVRGTFVCKGSVNRTLARLSQIFTLGIINPVETVTDWYDFRIYASTSSARGNER